MELVDATRRYLDANPEIAEDFVDRLESAFDSIARTPRRFPRIETIRTEREIRRVLLARFPYLVVYELLGNDPYILAIAHAHRRPAYWLERHGN